MPYSQESIIQHLRSANQVALKTIESGSMPFGAVLVSPDGEVLLKQGNVDTVRHAESELARKAAHHYSPEFLWQCALVTTFEPCAMCAGTLYWANIGTLIYGVEESKLLAITGNHEDNPTMSLDCRTVLNSGQKAIQVYGPCPELTEELIAPHLSFWK